MAYLASFDEQMSFGRLHRYGNHNSYERDAIARVNATKVRLEGEWVTRDGSTMLMVDMKNSHLRNSIEMLRRGAKEKAISKARKMEEFDVVTLSTEDIDELAYFAWGDVYMELVEEALSRSEDGDLNNWLKL